jgi:hypothetical protein
MASEIVSVTRLRELLDYDADTGRFVWRVKRTAQFPVGSVAGHVGAQGYRCITIDRRFYQAHRLVWLHVHGVWPVAQIDHRNGIRDDNRICNLREATNTFNCQNRRGPRKNGTSGFLGVSWYKASCKWMASIRVNGTQIHLGYFSTPEEAHAAYLSAKRLHHEGNTL